jgi:hypothetical protein
METSHSINTPENQTKASVWSVDRIARLIVGISNICLMLATYFLSSYFLIGLCFLNLNLVFTSLTDNCPFKNLLKRLGAKEREQFFNAKGELIAIKNKSDYSVNLQQSENV